MTGATEEATVAVVRRVRELDDVESGDERVIQAVTEVLGTPVIGRRAPTRRTSFPMRSGEDTTRIDVDLIAVRETPLRELLPRRTEVERESLARMLQATCEQLDIWPTPPSTSKSALALDPLLPVGGQPET